MLILQHTCADKVTICVYVPVYSGTTRYEIAYENIIGFRATVEPDTPLQYNGQISGSQLFPIKPLHNGHPTIMDKICGSKLSTVEGFHYMQ